MLLEFVITYATSAYHHLGCEFESRRWRGVPDKTLCDVYQCFFRELIIKRNNVYTDYLFVRHLLQTFVLV